MCLGLLLEADGFHSLSSGPRLGLRQGCGACGRWTMAISDRGNIQKGEQPGSASGPPVSKPVQSRQIRRQRQPASIPQASTTIQRPSPLTDFSKDLFKTGVPEVNGHSNRERQPDHDAKFAEDVIDVEHEVFPFESAGMLDDDSFYDPDQDKVLNLQTMNQAVVNMQYAVRGQVPTTAEKIAVEIATGSKKYPFEEVLFCNLGNPHSVGQKPIEYCREVLALADCPWLLDNPRATELFHADSVQRAQELIKYTTGGTGAYSHSQGILAIRKTVTSFIEERDGHPADPGEIFLTNGASTGIQMVLTSLINSRRDAVLVPVPQYPIYTALIELLRGSEIGYELDEENQWALSVDELQKQVDSSREKGLNPKAMVIINPGNPTGNCLSYENIKEIIQFCRKEHLMLLADEVYQENVYTDKPFISAKKVLRDLGPDYDDFEMASFHSTSKGIFGECGRRGGYMELVGVCPAVQSQMYKLASSGLCSNLDGQIAVDLMLNPPREGDESYPKWAEQRDEIFGGLQRKSAMLHETLNSIPGIHCQPLEGAMYAFPKIEMPEKAVIEANKCGIPPDVFYALSLLEKTGICAVPGSGFGQKAGTWHIRLTFLPDEQKLKAAMERFREHHLHFIRRFS